MTDDTDAHDQAHVTRDAEPLPRGYALLYQESTVGVHAQIVLTKGETDGELIACWVGEEGTPADWGLPTADVLWVAAHVIHHVIDNIPSNRCE